MSDIEELQDKRICIGCIGEPFLNAEVEKSGEEAECSYCDETDKTITIGELADWFEQVFEDHYQRSTSEMEPWEYAAHNDSESNYSWTRAGETAADVVADAALIDEDPSNDVAEILSERHYDFEDAKAGEECEFDGEARYVEKGVEDHALQANWKFFQHSLRTEARMFNRAAESALDEIFDGLSSHVTHDGKSIIVEAGPGKEIAALYRARVFPPYDPAIEEAISWPNRDIGPPPSKAAKSGRMNARGVSIFYGATEEAVAVAEVRPPVGSHVGAARFEIVQPLRLLDVEAFRSILVKGSLFDPSHVRRLESARFLRRLSDEITMPVMPEDEPSDYLVTQAIADYLAGRPDPVLDGIIYRSIQHGAGGINVALFHKSSRVKPLDIPKGTKIRATARPWGEDEGSTYMVWEESPVSNPKKSQLPPFYDYLTKSASDSEDDMRDAALQFDPLSMRIHHVTGVSFITEVHNVTRHRKERMSLAVEGDDFDVDSIL